MFRLMIIAILFFIYSISNAAIVTGNSSGRVTLIEVYDYQCSHCQKMANTMQRLIENNPDLKVKLIPVAISQNAFELSIFQASAAILTTQYDHAFEYFHLRNMSNPPKSKAEVVNILKGMKLLDDNFKKSMHSLMVKEQIDEGLAYLNEMHAGTPLFIIYSSSNPDDKRALKGEQEYSKLQQVINNARNH